MTSPRTFVSFILIVLIIISSGCAFTDSIQGGRYLADNLAKLNGFHRITLHTNIFDLIGYIRPGQAKTLVIYIAGDGKAWLNRHTPSSDPTPVNPVALRLATADPAPLVLFLGRPCQYVENAEQRNCSTEYWTNARFSEEVVQSFNEAVDQAMLATRAEHVVLAGYSGGGAIATLVASRRNDVVGLITIAGNLDHAAWTKLHKVTPLWRSLNPVEYVQSLKNIWQIHVVGEEDTNIPITITESFYSTLPDRSHAVIVKFPHMTHDGPWAAGWVDMLKRYRQDIR